MLTAEAIPLVGRIVAIADVFDALTHERPYKEAWSVERAVAHIRGESGLHFDPSVVTAFAALDLAARSFRLTTTRTRKPARECSRSLRGWGSPGHAR